MKRPVVRPKAIVFFVVVVVVVVVIVVVCADVGIGILPSPLNHSLSYSIGQNDVNSHSFQQHPKSFFGETRARVHYDIRVVLCCENLEFGLDGKASKNEK